MVLQVRNSISLPNVPLTRCACCSGSSRNRSAVPRGRPHRMLCGLLVVRSSRNFTKRQHHPALPCARRDVFDRLARDIVMPRVTPSPSWTRGTRPSLPALRSMQHQVGPFRVVSRSLHTDESQFTCYALATQPCLAFAVSRL